MFGDLGNFIQTALGMVAIVSLAGVGLQRTNTRQLKDRLEESDDEMVRKDRRLTEAEAEIVRLKVEVSAAEVKIQALGEQVRGDAYWAAVGVKQDAHDAAARAHWKAEEGRLTEIRDLLKGRTI